MKKNLLTECGIKNLLCLLLFFTFMIIEVNANSENNKYNDRFAIEDTVSISDAAVEAGLCPDSKHPHIIDLGNGVKWACCNIGASTPLEYGDYFSWGETERKSSYTWNNYRYCSGNENSCVDIGMNIANTKYDVAHIKWGGDWKIPTFSQVQDMWGVTTCLWTQINGVWGEKFTSKTNGNSIFLPACGFSDDNGNIVEKQAVGRYWTSTLVDADTKNAFCHAYTSTFTGWHYLVRCSGISVRALLSDGNYELVKEYCETADKYYKEENYTEAVNYYRKAAELGNSDAQNSMGYMYYEGKGIAQNYGKAVEWCRKSAEQGNAWGQSSMAEFCLRGHGVSKNYYNAAEWYYKAKDQGLEDDDFLKDGEYILLIKNAAEQGHIRAQSDLGRNYAEGKGVPQSYTEAAKWYRKAAEQGYAQAQFDLGSYYSNKDEVPHDYAEAAKWYRKAAEQGHCYAQLFMGMFYADGKGVPQNDAEAAKWYRKSAEQGVSNAQLFLGMCYANGTGVAQSYEEAVKWWKKAAEQGDAMSQVLLGMSYKNGNGVPRNLELAKQWFKKAADQGDEDARKQLEQIENGY